MNKKSIKQNGLIFRAKEFRAFIRLETCLFISAVGVSGYLLFNPISSILAPLFLTVFFATAAAYSYNNLTDRAEDRINNRRLNIFVANESRRAVFAMLAAGLFFSLFLTLPSLSLFLLSIPLIIAYSKFRVKEVLFAKNIYTGAVIGIAFLMGAASGGITAETLSPLPLAFFFGFMLNMLGDIRGYEGDLAAGVKTLPVSIGLEPSKKVAHSFLLGFSVLILLSRQSPFLLLVPFTFLMSFFLAFDMHKLARASMLTSFVAFSTFLFINSMEGGI